MFKYVYLRSSWTKWGKAIAMSCSLSTLLHEKFEDMSELCKHSTQGRGAYSIWTAVSSTWNDSFGRFDEWRSTSLTSHRMANAIDWNIIFVLSYGIHLTASFQITKLPLIFKLNIIAVIDRAETWPRTRREGCGRRACAFFSFYLSWLFWIWKQQYSIIIVSKSLRLNNTNDGRMDWNGMNERMKKKMYIARFKNQIKCSKHIA